MNDQQNDLEKKLIDLDKYAHLDSLEGFTQDVLAEPPSLTSRKGIVRILPGLLTAIVVGLAASFLSSHYGGPVMFFALLIGLAFDFLSREEKTKPGIEFSARTVLRLGVALLGARITITQIVELGVGPVLAVMGAVVFVILSGAGLARVMGLTKDQGLLSGGAVAICGASAALALSAVMPKNEHSERNTIFTVVSVTTLSTMAMIFYPILVGVIGFTDHEAGIFFGGTIHDVAQVVGAGYTVSQEAGDTSTIVKLLRVTMLLPAVLAYSFLYRKERASEDGKRPQTIPSFLIAFGILVIINSTGFMPEQAMTALGDLSRWCLITAIAALGMKTSFKALALIGWKPVILMVMETVLMALFVLAYLLFF
jgi:uncharacterized integral membrane protein (TIGR00698 family)